VIFCIRRHYLSPKIMTQLALANLADL
jgi:hypothetical protein